MSVKYAPVNYEEHAQYCVADFLSSSMLQSSTHAPIVRSELLMAVSSFPVAIMRDDGRDEYVLTVQFCLEASQNLFLKDGKWLGPYIPLDVRRRPFAVSASPNTAGGDDHEILINLESDLLTTESGHHIFESEGDESLFFRRQKEILTAILAGQKKTRVLIDALIETDLLTPLELALSTDQGPRRVTGLYGVHHGKFSSLTPSGVEKLHKLGVLQDCHFLLASYAQIQRLIWMENSISKRQILGFALKPAE